MKKNHNPTDINHHQGQELTKKLYRSISENAKRLDDARSCARNVGDLFTPNLIIQRKKLCDYCERLIFSDPVLYGRKGEELLWRKGFYDIVSTVKKLKKNEYLSNEITSIEAHINGGIGFYHHLLLRLQCEFRLNLKNITDFSLESEDETSADVKSATIEWAKQSVHQCLIYLGDLSRYKLEIYPKWEPTLALRYYLQAICYKPEHGMPHNQMGTLQMNRNRNLEAVYHYMRCLSCKFPFEGTTNNLQSLFEKNAKFIESLPPENKDADCIIEREKSENIKIFFARFLLLIDIWYFNKKVDKVYNLCHQILKNLEECLGNGKAPVECESGDSPLESESISSDTVNPYLNSSSIFQIVMICLICISKLRDSGSPQLSTAIAFTLGIYSQLIQNISNHMQESVLNYPLNKSMRSIKMGGILKDLMSGKKRSKSKLRRRKVVKIDSEEESEASDDGNQDYSSSDDSFISDNEDVLAVSSDEETDVIKAAADIKSPKDSLPNGVTNGMKHSTEVPIKHKDDIVKKVQFMDVNDMLEIVSEEMTLQCIKVLNDWLKNEPEILKSCAVNTKNVFGEITFLLNLININLVNSKAAGLNLKLSDIVHKEGKIPLTEDFALKGIKVLGNFGDNLDWDYISQRGLSVKEETVIRIIKLLCFGKYLTTLNDTGVKYDEKDNIFVCTLVESAQTDTKLAAALLDELELNEADGVSSNGIVGGLPDKLPIDGAGDQKNVGHRLTKMWLASEVRALENRVGGGGIGYGGGKATLSPYLVLDADALIRYTYAVKQLVHSRKFVVIVPSSVVSALDDLKREKIEAREAIRWLESQFHRGNRFFRAQRPQEKAAIPFIKYPKKKDKEMHIYIQIIECCHFLAEQQKGASNVVTLLIGNQNVLSNGENKEFSYVGLAQSVGITIEPISTFYGKWKMSKGKR